MVCSEAMRFARQPSHSWCPLMWEGFLANLVGEVMNGDMRPLNL